MMANIEDMDVFGGFVSKQMSLETLDDIVYTEDDIPVRTIFVSSICNSVANEDSLSTIFSIYGELESIKILSRPNCSKSNAFVTFVDAMAAANVLRNASDLYQFRISTAYSWHQPKPPSKTNEETDSEHQNEIDSILTLNDDCVIEIFSYLNLIDLSRITKVCQRFANLAETVFKSHESVDVSTYSNFTLMKWKEVLETMGYYIKSLFIKPQSFLNPPGIKIFEMVSNYCCHLEALSLEEFTLTRNVYKLKPLLRRLKTLVLDNCTVRHNFAEMFNATWQLETLIFKNSYEITGARLDRLIHLKSLAFTSCGNIQPRYLSQLLERQPNLQSLSLICCDRLTSSIFKDIALNSTKLTELNIEFTPGFRSNCREEDLLYLASLPNLTKFQFECDTCINISSLLTILADRNLLEELNVSCRTIDDDSFEAILRLTNLKVLHMNRTNVCEKWLSNIGERLTNLTELHLIHSVQVNDDGLMKLLKNAMNLKLIDISRTSVTLDGLMNCIRFLYAQFGQRPHLKVWMRSMDPCELQKKLEPYKNAVNVDFGAAHALEIFYKYFCKAPDSDSMSGHSLSDIYNSDDDELLCFL